jgi:hypothetical protein
MDAYCVTTKSAAVGYAGSTPFAAHPEQQAGAIRLSEVDAFERLGCEFHPLSMAGAAPLCRRLARFPPN